MRIAVEPEGREGVFLPERRSLIDWLREHWPEPIHCFLGANNPVLIGADWSVEKVIAEVTRAERVALLTGEAKRGNMNHALAVIVDNELRMFDGGEVDEHLSAASTAEGDND